MLLTMKIVEKNPDHSHANLLSESREISSYSQFSFTSALDSEYIFCFLDTPKGPNTPTRRVSIVWSEKKKDYAEVAKKENLKPIEVELRKMEDVVESLKEDFLHLKEREAIHRDTNESTNRRVAWLSSFSIFIVAFLGAAQVYYLRTYFKSKKII